ncbi:HAD domain-containing protein [Geopseudomonas aromaticivorans]
MILFLDFDGVLHPDAVYRRINGDIELRAAGEFFMWAPVLIGALEEHPDIRIVLSTSWARALGYDQARKRLPPALRERVIGATWHSAMGRGWKESIVYDVQTRYQQIATYLNRLPAPVPWLAIDDDVEGWPEHHRDRLVQTDDMLGLSTPEAQADLVEKVRRLAGVLEPESELDWVVTEFDRR